MRAIVGELVVLDDNQASDQAIDSEIVERKMRDGALAFLLGGMRGLENEDGLCEEEDAGAV
jgi:hypothetical protein